MEMISIPKKEKLKTDEKRKEAEAYCEEITADLKAGRIRRVR